MVRTARLRGTNSFVNTPAAVSPLALAAGRFFFVLFTAFAVFFFFGRSTALAAVYFAAIVGMPLALLLVRSNFRIKYWNGVFSGSNQPPFRQVPQELDSPGKITTSASERTLNLKRYRWLALFANIIERLPARTLRRGHRLVHSILPQSAANKLESRVKITLSEALSVQQARSLFQAGFETESLETLLSAVVEDHDWECMVEIARIGLNFGNNLFLGALDESLVAGFLASPRAKKINNPDRALLLEFLSRKNPEKAHQLVNNSLRTAKKDLDLACVRFNTHLRLEGSNPQVLAEAFEYLAQGISHDSGSKLSINPQRIESGPLSWRSLMAVYLKGGPEPTESGLVGVIVPARNAEATLDIALSSLRAQLYRNLRVVVVDDGSTDRTLEVAESFVAEDSRFKVLHFESQQGPYVARNEALKNLADCAFITSMDADDWSHPRKIALQVEELANQPALVASVTARISVSEDFVLTPRENFGAFKAFNLSSLLVRRGALDEVGPWLPLRFAADIEFFDRLKVRFGGKNVTFSPITLAFALSHSEQITRSTFGSGVRRSIGPRADFGRLYKSAHERLGTDAINDRAVWNLIEPEIPPEMLGHDTPPDFNCDVVIVSDFSFPGGTSTANRNEIEALMGQGKSVGLVHMPAAKRAKIPVRREFLKLVRAHLDLIRFVRPGTVVTAPLTTIHPASCGENALMPTVNTQQVKIIAHMIPNDPLTGVERYSVVRVETFLSKYFRAVEVEWCPVGPPCRAALDREKRRFPLSDKDWFSPYNPSRAVEVSNFMGSQIVLGRVSRDDFRKWPAGRKRILDAYPSDPRYRVRVLGGVEDIKSRYGFSPPSNWEVFSFGSVPVLDFLDTIDVFVYAIHEEHVEEFGLVVLEAIGANLPVVASRSLQPTFEDACLYFDTESEVPDLVERLRTDSGLKARLHQGREAVMQRHSIQSYLSRL